MAADDIQTHTCEFPDCGKPAVTRHDDGASGVSYFCALHGPCWCGDYMVEGKPFIDERKNCHMGDRCLRAVRWCFVEPEHAFEGFTDSTRWNGFLNVWVTPETHAAVLAYLRPDGDPASIADMESLVPGDDGLVSYAGGFATEPLGLYCDRCGTFMDEQDYFPGFRSYALHDDAMWCDKCVNPEPVMERT
jgi:hypothetical protein